MAQPAGIAPPPGVIYIMPLWPGFTQAGSAGLAAEFQNLQDRVGGGSDAVVGFSVTLEISMTDWTVNLSDPSAIRAALAGTIAGIDNILAIANAASVPVTISFLTAIRERVDPVQTASQAEDRRNMQWYSDNGRATGWWTHSRYARKQRAVQEAYIRELGSVVAERMAANPNIFVAATGDGEVELSFERAPDPQNAILADFSPFAVAEFRDWLRHGGLYAPGQPFAGEGYVNGARYAGDASPNDDTNGDGNTINSDFGTGFTDWRLRFADWDLADNPFSDPNAIPGDPGPPADLGPSRFDAPRTYDPNDPWWIVWNDFRQHMIWRHNLEFAEWMTTTPSRAAGETIPPERWYSYQIAADYLFGHTPAAPDWRLITSASPWWTANVSPFGSTGITAFNTNAQNGTFGRTLAGVAPQISQAGVRWGIIEWNPSVPGSPDLGIYRDEIALVEQHGASLVIPFLWDSDPTYQIQDTAFEAVLSELAGSIENAQYLTLDRVEMPFAGVSGAAPLQSQTSSQTVTVVPQGGSLDWTVTANQPWIQVSPLAGSGVGTFSISVVDTGGLPPSGTVSGSVTVSAAGSSNAPHIVIELTLYPPFTTTGPFGVIDTPLPNIVNVSGSLGVTGWALDDIEVVRVQIYRDPVPPEAPGTLIYVGDAVMIDGARPDVAAGNTNLPYSTRAGWGFLILTNMLPNLGNGPYTLHVFAIDAEGLSTLLGSRAFTANNALATLPFGAIDTPMQGETVSGDNYLNFGWAIPQPPAVIPLDGSTINVFVDGVPVGNPDYGHSRPDISTLFSSYPGAATAVGFLALDTTAYVNGLHTIAWGVTDSLGRSAGIGSRFFWILNPVGGAASPPPSRLSGSNRIAPVPARGVGADVIHMRRGYQLNGPARPVSPDPWGVYHVRGEALERIELHLGGEGAAYRGSLEGGQSLPMGAALDAATGVFTWQPAIGYVGTYTLNFWRTTRGGATARIPVRLTLAPQYADQVTPRMAVDLPGSNEVTQPFTVAGWAVDLAAPSGPGVSAVHVWAFPVGRQYAGPIFLGAAEYGGGRPDVAALHGPGFASSGYGLTVFGLAPGTYDLAVYAYSSVAGAFNNAQLVRVEVR